jgi:hypothetical protein
MITTATALENEAMIQFILWEREGGEREVETPFGFVDLLTDEEVIEIKHIRNWKDASKVLVYASFFPTRKPRVHLFGGYSKELRQMVEQAFAHLKISVTWELEPY